MKYEDVLWASGRHSLPRERESRSTGPRGYELHPSHLSPHTHKRRGVVFQLHRWLGGFYTGVKSCGLGCRKYVRGNKSGTTLAASERVLWYSAKLLLAGYLILSGKRGTPLTTILPDTIVNVVLLVKPFINTPRISRKESRNFLLFFSFFGISHSDTTLRVCKRLPDYITSINADLWLILLHRCRRMKYVYTYEVHIFFTSSYWEMDFEATLNSSSLNIFYYST